MNKTNNCTTGTAIKSENKQTLKMLKKRQQTSSSSGCLYITHVNLYLHPNSEQQTSTSTTLQDEMPKVKSQCCNPDCFYYDSEILSDYYYCCNPGCYCFKPDWYYYL
jgi:hypothetical protein